MSQRNVEQVLGRLLTDEGFRDRFARAPFDMVRQLVDEGTELNPCEQRALTGLDVANLSRFADCLDPCIQKIQLRKQT